MVGPEIMDLQRWTDCGFEAAAYDEWVAYGAACGVVRRMRSDGSWLITLGTNGRVIAHVQTRDQTADLVAWLYLFGGSRLSDVR